jgi:hypothetical protein
VKAVIQDVHTLLHRLATQLPPLLCLTQFEHVWCKSGSPARFQHVQSVGDGGRRVGRVLHDVLCNAFAVFWTCMRRSNTNFNDRLQCRALLYTADMLIMYSHYHHGKGHDTCTMQAMNLSTVAKHRHKQTATRQHMRDAGAQKHTVFRLALCFATSVAFGAMI